MLHYILQVLSFQFLFLVIYDLFLRKETFFNLNRIYLLVTAVLSMVIPFVKIDQIKTVISRDIPISLPEVFLSNSSESISTIDPEIAIQAGINIPTQTVSIWTIFLIVGMSIAMIVLLFKISKLFWLVSKSPKQWKDNVMIVSLNGSNKAFSFFNYVFLGDQLKVQEQSSILQHELVHVQQKHTLDLLFFELMRIVFWFNPLVYIYQNRIATTHEYIADAKAVKQHNKNDYYDNLLAQVFETQQFSFVNPFFKQSLIKKRILMLSKSRSQHVNLFKYLLIVPLIMGMLVYTSCSVFKKKQDKTVVNSERQVIEKEEVPFGTVDEVPVFESCKDIEDQDERKKCMSKEVAIHVNRNFNMKIGDSLGLIGRQRINVLFKIDKEGNITGVKARAPHPKLEEEAVRVIKTLPKFTPGKHKGKTVVVPYSLPIVFELKGKPKNNTTSPSNNQDRVKELKEKFKNADEVPFVALDKAPTSEGCNNLVTEKDTKACFSGFISGYVNESFNVDLASKLGLVGKQRISVLFKVDKNGRVYGARARAPHPQLETEAIRVINSLPQFSPGEMNGKPVIVNYSLPILFQVASDKNTDKKN